MAAGDGNARLGADFAAAGKDLTDLSGRQLVDGHAQNRQRHDRPPAHGIDVGNGVGGGDAAEIARIVHHRHEEIGGRNDAGIIVHLPDGGIVGGLGPDQKLRKACHRLIGQSSRRTEGASTAAAAAMRQRGQSGMFVHVRALRSVSRRTVT